MSEQILLEYIATGRDMLLSFFTLKWHWLARKLMRTVVLALNKHMVMHYCDKYVEHFA